MRVHMMSDEKLKSERGKVANVRGKYAAKRFLAILNEEIKREAERK